jgi:hypothetical protein
MAIFWSLMICLDPGFFSREMMLLDDWLIDDLKIVSIMIMSNFMNAKVLFEIKKENFRNNYYIIEKLLINQTI